jgi:hypothetical protein
VAYGFRRLYNNGVPPGTPIDVRIDSPTALSFLHDWTHGSTRMPSDYRSWRTSGNAPTNEGRREEQASTVHHELLQAVATEVSVGDGGATLHETGMDV